MRYHVGNLFSADLFYTPDPDMFDTMAKYDVLGVEMEAAGIYPICAEHGVEALAICTVSDDIRSGVLPAKPTGCVVLQKASRREALA